MKKDFVFVFLFIALLSGACSVNNPNEITGENTAEIAVIDVEATEAVTEITPEPTTLDSVDIRYNVWDGNQAPAYEACAAEFTKIYPHIKVEVDQLAWGDYWTGLEADLEAGTAPDVFTNHLTRYPEFYANQQILDIQPFVDADGVDVGIYLGDLEQLWVRDGARFGLPKDWDTVALIYDAEVLAQGGVSIDELNNATWNPEDGGTFGEIVKKLTIDENGNNGLSPDFDKNAVVQHGFVADYPGGGAYGQAVFSMFSASTGWEFVDGLYATEYNFDDPRFIATMQWFQDMIAGGFFTSYEDVSGLDYRTVFESGGAALTVDGSWQIGFYSGIEGKDVGFARLPIGPEGRKSMFNGLADSIWSGTEHPQEAWEWVKYAASPACADLVGNYGVVFPAIQSGVWNAIDVYTDRGVDVSAFTLQVEEGGTFLFPITDHASSVTEIMNAALEQIYLGQIRAEDILPEANSQVNAVFNQ